MYILTLYLFVSGTLAASTAEYNSKDACETAVQEQRIAVAANARVVLAHCSAKGIPAK